MSFEDVEIDVEPIMRRSVAVSQMVQDRCAAEGADLFALISQQQRDIGLLYDLLQNERSRAGRLEERLADRAEPQGNASAKLHAVQLAQINRQYRCKVWELVEVVRELRTQIAVVAHEQDALQGDYARVRAAHVLAADVEFRDELL